MIGLVKRQTLHKKIIFHTMMQISGNSISCPSHWRKTGSGRLTSSPMRVAYASFNLHLNPATHCSLSASASEHHRKTGKGGPSPLMTVAGLLPRRQQLFILGGDGTSPSLVMTAATATPCPRRRRKLLRPGGPSSSLANQERIAPASSWTCMADCHPHQAPACVL